MSLHCAYFFWILSRFLQDAPGLEMIFSIQQTAEVSAISISGSTTSLGLCIMVSELSPVAEDLTTLSFNRSSSWSPT